MSDDVDLARAFRAVKDEYDGDSPDADLTLQRALFASRGKVQRRRVAQWVLVPIAAALVASTAWAGATGRLAPMLSSFGEALHTSREGPPAPGDGPPIAGASAERDEEVGVAGAIADAAAPSGADEATATLAAAALAPAARTGVEPAREPAGLRLDDSTQSRAAAPVDLAPAADRARATVGAADARRGPPSSASAARPPTAEAGGAPVAVAPAPSARPARAAPERDAQLFAEANRVHFVERDAVRALAAWDRYLAAAPNGTLAPEARYNRALTLVRLGRAAEARTELERFAAGTYRRVEARALLDAIARDAGAP